MQLVSIKPSDPVLGINIVLRFNPMEWRNVGPTPSQEYRHSKLRVINHRVFCYQSNVTEYRTRQSSSIWDLYRVCSFDMSATKWHQLRSWANSCRVRRILPQPSEAPKAVLKALPSHRGHHTSMACRGYMEVQVRNYFVDTPVTMKPFRKKPSAF